MSRTVQIFDTTLRDGAQAEGVSYSLQDKRQIAHELDAFGVDYIEAGNPASNPKDFQFFEEMKAAPLSRAKLCAFGSTARPNQPVEQDEALQKLIGAGTRRSPSSARPRRCTWRRFCRSRKTRTYASCGSRFHCSKPPAARSSLTRNTFLTDIKIS